MSKNKNKQKANKRKELTAHLIVECRKRFPAGSVVHCAMLKHHDYKREILSPQRFYALNKNIILANGFSMSDMMSVCVYYHGEWAVNVGTIIESKINYLSKFMQDE